MRSTPVRLSYKGDYKVATKRTPAKKTAKKAATKKTATKKVATKKAAAKKAAPKKTSAKKAPAKKTTKKAAPKAAAKKATKSAKKATKKAPAKATKKAAAKKAAAKKTTKKASTSKRASTSKSTTTRAKVSRSTTPTDPSKRTIPKSYKYLHDKKWLKQQRDALIVERANYTSSAERLAAEAAALMADREPGDVQFDEESGEGDTIAVERDRDLALSAAARQSVAEIDAALERLDKNTYGMCLAGDDIIPRERLEAIPEASVCVTHKTSMF